METNCEWLGLGTLITVSPENVLTSSRTSNTWLPILGSLYICRIRMYSITWCWTGWNKATSYALIFCMCILTGSLSCRRDMFGGRCAGGDSSSDMWKFVNRQQQKWHRILAWILFVICSQQRRSPLPFFSKNSGVVGYPFSTFQRHHWVLTLNKEQFIVLDSEWVLFSQCVRTVSTCDNNCSSCSSSRAAAAVVIRVTMTTTRTTVATTTTTTTVASTATTTTISTITWPNWHRRRSNVHN